MGFLVPTAWEAKRPWSHRRELMYEDQRLGANLIFLECRASDQTLRGRLAGREDGESMLDARMEHLKGMIESHEPLDELDEMAHVILDTEKPLMDTLVEAFSEGHIRRVQQSVSTAT